MYFVGKMRRIFTVLSGDTITSSDLFADFICTDLMHCCVVVPFSKTNSFFMALDIIFRSNLHGLGLFSGKARHHQSWDPPGMCPTT